MNPEMGIQLVGTKRSGSSLTTDLGKNFGAWCLLSKLPNLFLPQYIRALWLTENKKLILATGIFNGEY